MYSIAVFWCFGIIPTRMGTRESELKTYPSTADHPHAYGDKINQAFDKNIIVGSSPRVWGQELQNRSTVRRRGIIPTRMGTRNLGKSLPLKHRDHPHAYGDKDLHRLGAFARAGSSPRVWGQAIYWVETRIDNGIIPTRMGTSEEGDCFFNLNQDHPHAYGDKKSF